MKTKIQIIHIKQYVMGMNGLISEILVLNIKNKFKGYLNDSLYSTVRTYLQK